MRSPSRTTRPASTSAASASAIFSTEMPTSSCAWRSRSGSDVQQCPASSASVWSVWTIEARARRGESCGMPTARAMRSAVAKPMPQMSRLRR